MGFYASHLDCACEFDSSHLRLQTGSSLFSIDEFWRQARDESTRLHERLERLEALDETASQDTYLVDQLEKRGFANGGGVHFALSNLGAVNSRENSNEKQHIIELDEFYYQVSLESYRWSSLVFNGVSTLDGNLFWGITYNSKFIRSEIIKYTVECVKFLFDKLTTDA